MKILKSFSLMVRLSVVAMAFTVAAPNLQAFAAPTVPILVTDSLGRTFITEIIYDAFGKEIKAINPALSADGNFLAGTQVAGSEFNIKVKGVKVHGFSFVINGKTVKVSDAFVQKQADGTFVLAQIKTTSYDKKGKVTKVVTEGYTSKGLFASDTTAFNPATGKATLISHFEYADFTKAKVIYKESTKLTYYPAAKGGGLSKTIKTITETVPVAKTTTITTFYDTFGQVAQIKTVEKTKGLTKTTVEFPQFGNDGRVVASQGTVKINKFTFTVLTDVVYDDEFPKQKLIRYFDKNANLVLFEQEIYDASDKLIYFAQREFYQDDFLNDIDLLTEYRVKNGVIDFNRPVHVAYTVLDPFDADLDYTEDTLYEYDDDGRLLSVDYALLDGAGTITDNFVTTYEYENGVLKRSEEKNYVVQDGNVHYEKVLSSVVTEFSIENGAEKEVTKDHVVDADGKVDYSKVKSYNEQTAKLSPDGKLITNTEKEFLIVNGSPDFSKPTYNLKEEFSVSAKGVVAFVKSEETFFTYFEGKLERKETFGEVAKKDGTHTDTEYTYHSDGRLNTEVTQKAVFPKAGGRKLLSVSTVTYNYDASGVKTGYQEIFVDKVKAANSKIRVYTYVNGQPQLMSEQKYTPPAASAQSQREENAALAAIDQRRSVMESARNADPRQTPQMKAENPNAALVEAAQAAK